MVCAHGGLGLAGFSQSQPATACHGGEAGPLQQLFDRWVKPRPASRAPKVLDLLVKLRPATAGHGGGTFAPKALDLLVKLRPASGARAPEAGTAAEASFKRGRSPPLQ